MSDPQSIYDNYVKQYGIPKQPNHLIAYAKKSGTKIKFSEARQIITINASSNNTKSNKKPPNKSNTNKSNTNKSNTNKSNTIKSNTSKPSTKPKWPPEPSKNTNNIKKPFKKSNPPKPPKSTSIKSNPPKSSSINQIHNKSTSIKPNNKPNPPKTTSIKSNSSKRNNTWPPVKTSYNSNKKPPPKPPKSENTNTINIAKKPPVPKAENKNSNSKPKSKWPIAKKPPVSIPSNINTNHNWKPIQTASKMKPKTIETKTNVSIIPSKQSQPFSPPPPNIVHPISPPLRTSIHGKTPPPPPIIPKQISIKSAKFVKNSNPPRKKNIPSTPPPPRIKKSNKMTKSKPPPPRFRSKSNGNAMPPPPKLKNASKSELLKKRSLTKLPHPPPRFRKSNSDEKMDIIAPFMCRINYECKNIKCKNEIYNALKMFTNMQLKACNYGTITYHFTTPNPVKYPLKLEFIELYYNENAFIKMMESKTKQFDEKIYNKNMTSKTMITIGDNISDKMKGILRDNYKSIFPKSECGYLFHENYLKSLDYTDDSKLMFKFHLISPGNNNVKNIEILFDIMNRLSIYAKDAFALMFHCHRLNVISYPNYLELIAIWPNVQCLIEFLENNKVQMIMMEFKQFMITETDKINRKNHFLCELYSDIEINDNVMDIMSMVFDDIGYMQQIKTDVGYILHPNANSSKLN